MVLIPPPVTLQGIIEFTQQLTSIPSLESEQAIAPCIVQKLTNLGFEPHLIGDPEHPSVICHHQAATATKAIWLQSPLIPLRLAVASQFPEGVNVLNVNITRLLERLWAIAGSIGSLPVEQ